MEDAYFEAMYETDPDPWGFDHRFYERRKFDVTVAALPSAHYRRGYEPGCSNGALTERLATRCDQLIASDIMPAPVERARHRLRHAPHVDIRLARFPDEWPDGGFDLIVWSEIAYYLNAESLQAAIDRTARSLEGDLVVVNYTGDTHYPATADDVDDAIERSGRFVRRCSLADELFRLDIWRPHGATT